MVAPVALCNATGLNYFSAMSEAQDLRGEPEEDPGAGMGDAADEFACTHSALRRAARRLGYLYDEAVAPTGLKATQLGLLSRIDRLGGEDGPTLQRLADHLAIRISALTHALRPLVRDGLIELRPDAHDRRTKHAALTQPGRQRLSEGTALWAAANRKVEAVLGGEAAGLLRGLADQVSSEAFLEAFKSGSPLEPRRR